MSPCWQHKTLLKKQELTVLLHRGQRSDDCRFLTVSLCFNAEHTEAILVVVKGDALDDAGDFLGHGSAFRNCGIHVWRFIFPWMVCIGDEKSCVLLLAM